MARCTYNDAAAELIPTAALVRSILHVLISFHMRSQCAEGTLYTNDLDT
jgi:hypothetical protein